MRLPHENDPGGSAEGTCRRQRVLEVLFEFKVDTHHQGDLVYLEKDGIVRAYDLPDLITGQVIRHLSRMFDIPIEEFYRTNTTDIH